MKKAIGFKVFPSTEETISVISEDKEMEVGYPEPCHKYEIRDCIGFKDGETQYIESFQTIQFVQKNKDGSIIPGAQSEQVIGVCMHRLNSMNQAFPSIFNDLQKKGLELFLLGCKMRVEDRINKGIMGELKK